MKKISDRGFLLPFLLFWALGIRVEEAASASITEICDDVGEVTIEIPDVFATTVTAVPACVNIPNSEFSQAISPVTASTQVMHEIAQQQMSSIRNHMKDQRDEGKYASSFSDIANVGVFVTGSLADMEQDDQGDNIGFDSSSDNLMIGADHMMSDTLVLGVSLSFSEQETDFNSGFGNQDFSMTSLATFGNLYVSDNTYLDWLLSYSAGEMDSRRVLESESIVAESNGTDIETISAAVTLGHDWVVADWEFGGYGRLEYTDKTIDGYSESGSVPGRLIVDKQNADFLESALGASVAHISSFSNSVLVSTFELEWIHRRSDSSSATATLDLEGLDTAILEEIRNDNPFLDEEELTEILAQINEGLADNAPFNITGAEMDGDYFSASLSFSATYTNGVSAFFDVETLFGDDLQSRQTYTIGVRWMF